MAHPAFLGRQILGVYTVMRKFDRESRANFYPKTGQLLFLVEIIRR
jgi:hypothetical protein